MIRFSKFATLAAFLLITAVALPVTVAGKWTGKLKATFVPNPAMKPAPTADQIKKQNALLAKIKIFLTIDAKGVYTATTIVPGNPSQTGKGTWKLKGSTLTLVPNDKRAPEVGTLGKDGKSLTVALPVSMTKLGITGSAVFKKS